MSEVPEAVRSVLESPCGCTGQCGTPHGSGQCGSLPHWSARHCAAPADPSAPAHASPGRLLSWCPPCYRGAWRRGQEVRAEQAAVEAADAQSSLF